MAREDALSIFSSGETKDKLAELHNGLIESIQKGAVSEQIKNKDYSGDPTTGSVEVNRFKNSGDQTYGTARTAGEGDKLFNNGKVVVNIDQHKEIVEEVNATDLKLHGVGGIVEKRQTNQKTTLISVLDRAFFVAAEAAASVFTPTAATLVGKLEQLIQEVETTVNDWVDGVDREMIVLTVSPAVYGELANYIDSVPNPLTNLTDNVFHKVRIFSNHRQTADAVCMVEGAVAQPVLLSDYEPEKIPLSNDYAVELFYDYGTKAVTPDLIQKVAELVEVES
jgi:hypothetical protein